MKRQKTITIILTSCIALFVLAFVSTWAKAQSQGQGQQQSKGQQPGQAPSGQTGQQKPGQQPPPYTKEEYDAFQKINQETDNKKKVEMIEDFLKKYPNSKLEVNVRYTALSTYQQLNNADKIIEHGERFLQLQPEDISTMSFLAWVYAERVQSNPSYKDKALKNAQTAIESLDKMQKPANLTDQQWTDAKAKLLSMDHSTLGFIYLQNGYASKEKGEREKEFSKAVDEFQKALSLNKTDDLSWYRMGLAYAEQNKAQEAINSLAKAVALKGSASEFARTDLERIYKKLNKDSLQGLDEVIRKAGEEVKSGKTEEPKPEKSSEPPTKP